MYGFKERKAAQVAAYFALKSGGAINILKLAKLVYLVERESMRRFDEPMFYDKLVSMDHGPVASMTLNGINGLRDTPEWIEFLAGRKNYDVLVSENKSLNDLDELSRADLNILEFLWEKFGSYNRYELRDWTHDNCQEWVDPKGSSFGIAHGHVFGFLEKPNAAALAEEIEHYRNRAFVMDAC